jgi:MFS family permease
MDRTDRVIVLFTSLSHAVVHTFELSIPIFVTVWLTEFSASTATLGITVAFGYGLFGIGALPGGVLADRYGSRTLILGCLIGMTVAFLLLSVADGVVAIGAAIAIWGIGASVYHPAGLSLISTGVEKRGTALAYHGMAGNVGIALGPLLTALLLLVFDWRVVARLLVLPAVTAAIIALWIDFDEYQGVPTEETASSSVESVSQFLTRSRSLFTAGFTLAMCVVMMNGLFYRASLTFLPEVLGRFVSQFGGAIGLFASGSPLAQEFDLAFYLYAGLLLVGTAGQYTSGALSESVEPRTALAVVFGCLAVVTAGFVPAARFGTVPLLIASGLLGFLLFALQPLYQTVIAEESPPESRGLSYGYTYLISFGFGAGGAVLSGYLLSVFTTDATFLLLSVLPVLGAIGAIALRQRARIAPSL